MGTMEPIVFVDIDGVLNTSKNYHVWNKHKDEEYRRKVEQSPDEQADDARWTSVTDDAHVLDLFDAGLIGQLNKITSATGAKIVVSSSWRWFYGNSQFDKLRKIFKDAGAEADVLGPTPVNVHDRGLAITAWLEENRGMGIKNWGRYVILDDEYRSCFPRPCQSHMVQTNPGSGLEDHDVTKAIHILNGGER